MNRSRLALESLRYYWRSNMGVLLGATLATAILVGALAVGDSVRASLRDIALARLGKVQFALNSQSRFFRQALADGVSGELKAPVAPVILLRGTAANGDLRAGRIQIVGVDDRFWSLAASQVPPAVTSKFSGPADQDVIVLSDRLAAVLTVKPGDEVLVRADKPSLLSRDAPLSTVNDASVALRLTVAAIVPDSSFGRFSLDANQVPPLNAFLPIGALQRKIGMEGRANVLLVGPRAGPPIKAVEATGALWNRWDFSDAGLEMRQLPGKSTLELRTDRVFLDPPIGFAAEKAASDAEGVLTYFVNELKVRDRSTPYSTVSALQGPLIPAGMKPDEILVNQWLADDLKAKPGDEITLKYWIVGPMRRLTEQSTAFRIRAVLPMSGGAVDRDLMPPIPGLADKKDCRDWEPGVPIDLKKIRDVDQKYWTDYRGSPKGFITLDAGRKIWNNRFGDLTAVRFPMAAASRQDIESRLRQAINPASLGLFFVPVREQALSASSQSLDFGMLFLGFSLFLIVAAILLTALLFALSVEQRSEEVGTLLSLGWTPARVRRQLLIEGSLLALAAGAVGAGLGVFYTRATIQGLSTVWRNAVSSSVLRYHAEPSTILYGALASILIALPAIWLVVRKNARAPARELLAGGADSASNSPAISGKAVRRASWPLSIAIVSIGSAFVLTVMALSGGKERGEAYFFGAGALLLIGGIAACHVLIKRVGLSSAAALTIGSLGVRNSARRLGRSMSAVALLACGSFLVVSVGANRKDTREGAELRSSGTGGFSLYAETTLPVYQDLNTPEGRDAFNLDAGEMKGVDVVAMRLREGDEASCLNLNRALTPNLLGVQPDALSRRKAFTFAQTVPGSIGTHDPWRLLELDSADGTIPVIGDVNTLEWSLGKSLGAIVPYVDDRGNTLKLRIVGVIANSVLQGHLMMSEANFIKHFPTLSGYQVFLLDAPAGKEQAVRQSITRALDDVGVSITPTASRLAAFNEVENTYLSIFAMLGGLGLMLGSLGLGVIVLRNVLERRGELALLRAVGYRVSSLHWLIFSEHALLLALGLGVGVASALISVLPVLRSPGANAPIASLVLTLGAILVSGFVWTWGATSLALRGPLLPALRNE